MLRCDTLTALTAVTPSFWISTVVSGNVNAYPPVINDPLVGSNLIVNLSSEIDLNVPVAFDVP